MITIVRSLYFNDNTVCICVKTSIGNNSVKTTFVKCLVVILPIPIYIIRYDVCVMCYVYDIL